MNFQELLFASAPNLEKATRANFCYLWSVSSGEAPGTWHTYFVRQNWELNLYTLYLLSKQNQSFLVKRIYSCNIILLWGKLEVNASANVGRKRGLLLPKALEINLEQSQRKTLLEWPDLFCTRFCCYFKTLFCYC